MSGQQHTQRTDARWYAFTPTGGGQRPGWAPVAPPGTPDPTAAWVSRAAAAPAPAPRSTNAWQATVHFGGSRSILFLS
ncbi:hypothetical protein GCM10012275_21640 [Longimycelium tulufanense]|uniref:Uncharacterized protein n=1 Tax=Longimycelium tulufanense TaxID=907463 RepID=A0A8J3C7L5_9PSEU|nr:hypothetical protein [Longimycelium tulufanense]GGM50433.1 hypothetical protein GCM10012275_21640 [Longimycelium tulufanense]